MSVNRLTDIDIKFISLVKKGANGKQVILKSAEFAGQPDISKQVKIRKYDDVEGIVYGIVYGPGEIDAHEDYADKSEIKKACYRFMKSGLQLNIDRDHDEKQVSAFVAESWITKANDSFFSDDPEGSWAVGIKLEDEDLKKAAAKGEIAGLSMAGMAKRTPVGEIKKEAKTFDSAYASSNLWQIVDALSMSIRSILDDLEAGNKAELITQSFDECKQTVLGQIKNIDKPNTEKEESVVEKILEKLSKMLPVKKADEPAEPDEPAVPDTGDADLAGLVKEGFDKIAESFQAFETRLIGLEDATKVSKQNTDPKGAGNKQTAEEALGSEIAKMV